MMKWTLQIPKFVLKVIIDMAIISNQNHLSRCCRRGNNSDLCSRKPVTLVVGVVTDCSAQSEERFLNYVCSLALLHPGIRIYFL
jgi:hypothetical protein